MKKRLSAFIITTLVLTTTVLSGVQANAATADWSYAGKDCTSNSSASATIDYIQAKYPEGTKYKGSGECYGWAEKISTMLAKKRSTKKYTGLKFNKNNFLAKCKGLKAGTHLRLSNKKQFNGTSGHSIVLLKVTNTKVYWTEANMDGRNRVHYAVASPKKFVSRYNYKYLNAVTKTLSYKTGSSPSLAATAADDGKTQLFWTKTSGTQKYKVYRATSKNGKYKVLKTTTKRNYKDTSAKIGTNYYYKVKAIRAKKSDPVSAKISFRNKLATPKITSISNKNVSGKIQLKWTKVPGADKYYIYRLKNLSSFTYTYLTATTDTTYIDKSAINPADVYSYKVKAVCTKNSKGNSARSEATDYENPRLPAPEVRYTQDPATGNVTITWNKIKYANHYDIYLSTNKKSSYPYYTDIKDLTITFDASSFVPGEINYIWVVAASEAEDSIWNDLAISMPSNYIKIQAPVAIP